MTRPRATTSTGGALAASTRGRPVADERRVMRIKKGQLLKIDHARKGLFVAVALRDFESKEETWFPVATTERCDGGLGTTWAPGEEIPCRASFVRSIEAVEVEEEQCPAD